MIVKWSLLSVALAGALYAPCQGRKLSSPGSDQADRCWIDLGTQVHLISETGYGIKTHRAAQQYWSYRTYRWSWVPKRSARTLMTARWSLGWFSGNDHWQSCRSRGRGHLGPLSSLRWTGRIGSTCKLIWDNPCVKCLLLSAGRVLFWIGGLVLSRTMKGVFRLVILKNLGLCIFRVSLRWLAMFTGFKCYLFKGSCFLIVNSFVFLDLLINQ